jgi:hypothetical protein
LKIATPPSIVAMVHQAAPPPPPLGIIEPKSVVS